MASTRLRTKPARFVLSPYQSAETAIGLLVAGCRILGLTKGQFSILDMLAAVLAQTGPAHVVVSTWTTGIRDAENAKLLLDAGKILTFRLLTDRSFPTRQPKYVEAVRRAFGDGAIRATNTHAKFCLIENERWHVAIRSSMNLNRNPRFEQFDLDDDIEVCDFLRAHVDEMDVSMPAGLKPAHRQVVAGFTAALGGGVSPLTPLDGALDEDAPIDMEQLFAPAQPLTLFT